MKTQADIAAVARHRIAIDGDGVNTLVVFMTCPLRCRYCLNPQTLDAGLPHRTLTPDELYEETRKDELYFLATGGGVTFGGGEPLLRPDFIRAFRSLCGDEWKLNLETSLNVPEDNARGLMPAMGVSRSSSSKSNLASSMQSGRVPMTRPTTLG